MILAKASWGKLFKFILIKISYSFVTILLVFLSLIITSFSTILFFSLNMDSDKFFTTFQYYIIIFYAILLFIFVLMNSIKIFGLQFEDRTFLLLLTKPYSRKMIILTQYLSLFLISLCFIFFNIVILLVIGGILGVILKTVYLQFYILMILKLFLFLILFSILVTTGSVALLAFTSSQTVFLIFIIFCSLFLLGGLPYSLISKETENLTLSFKNGFGPYTVKQIKSAMLFNKYYSKGLMRYPDLTRDIANFYNSLTFTELKNIKSSSVLKSRIDFFKNEGLILSSQFNSGQMEGKVITWNNHSNFNDHQVKITLVFNTYFLNINQLEKSIINQPNNIFNNTKKDLLQLYKDYDNNFEINDFMILQKSKVPDLLEYDITSCSVYDINTKKTEKLTADDYTKAFKDSGSYVKFSAPLRNRYDNIFFNPIYILIRTVEDYIYNQIFIFHAVTNSEILNDENFIKFSNDMDLYIFINYFNFFEHWNQIWTNFMGYYGSFWFKPLALSNIDFNIQKNTLFSYPDFKFHLTNDFKINTTDMTNIQNNLIAVLMYSSLCIILFILSNYLFLKKNIN